MQNAAKLTFNGTNSWKGTRVTAPTATYTGSVYLKVEDGGADFTATLTMYATGAGGSTENHNVTITSEWQRFDKQFTTYQQGAGATYFVIRSNVDGRSCLAYGAQHEAGSYPTSYIPTYGASVTRSGDACYLQNTDVHSSGAGTIFFEVGDYDTNTSASGFNKILVFDEVATTSLDNVIYFEEYAGDNTILIRKGGSTLLQSTPNYQDLRGSKIAIKWSSEEAKIFIDGVLNKTYTGDASLDIQYFGF